MYNYQKSGRYFAQYADDIKEAARRELEELGATDVKESYRGAHFSADAKTLYQINYRSRLLNRVLAPITDFYCHNDGYLYRSAKKIEWSDFLTPESTFAVFATVSHSKINHSKFAALRLKDAIVDYFKEKDGKRPNIDTRDPDLWLNLHIENNHAQISIDTSGGSLHRRGYRLESVQAPMAETVAATIIEYSQWDGTTPLYDPMCGSGTLLAEAYLKATGTPVSYMRKKFGFMRLTDFDPAIWKAVKSEIKIKELNKGLISGSDILGDAVKAARSNLNVIDKKQSVSVKRKDLFDITELKDMTIVTNPPYGIRIHKNGDMEEFYKKLGDFLKQRCSGSTAYIYFGERKYLKNIGLRPAWKKVLINGGLDGRLAKFEMY